jgi:hypothetical protein
MPADTLDDLMAADMAARIVARELIAAAPVSRA